MLELGWVLAKSLRLPRETVASQLERILDLETITAENAEGLHWALDRYRAGADLSDAVHVSGCARTASGFVTFDEALIRKLARSSPIPLELIEI